MLDHDADMIEAARAFGYKVFYGDATRLDLLRTAGAATAKVLVVAVDDIEQSLAIVDLAREHFPHLELVARARDVTHWNELRDRGVARVEREVFEASLRSARTVLEVLGFAPHEARAHAMRFRRHNLQLFEQMYPHHKDRAKVIAVVKQGRRQLEEQMAQERAEREQRRREGQEAARLGRLRPGPYVAAITLGSLGNLPKPGRGRQWSYGALHQNARGRHGSRPYRLVPSAVRSRRRASGLEENSPGRAPSSPQAREGSPQRNPPDTRDRELALLRSSHELLVSTLDAASDGIAHPAVLRRFDVLQHPLRRAVGYPGGQARDLDLKGLIDIAARAA